MKRILKIYLVIIVLLFGGSTCLLIYAYVRVSKEVSAEMKNGIIQTAMISESPVYYEDGETVLGVFFDKAHQKYIHFHELPIFFKNAVIATEDQRFYQHHGFDAVAILRAALHNIRAGNIVQGGSTITQQTAKNLFMRQGKSFGAKSKELIQAVNLEKSLTKEQIFELYTNQFHVAGAGRGIGIAARYFFNKEAKDLNLVESAFIAGAIKGPNTYNPFTKKAEDTKKAALTRANNRKNYVLSRMLDMKFITAEQYEEGLKEEVPFKGGKITYELNVILDYIQKQLQNDYFRNVFDQCGINNTATSGIKIFTSINREIQEGALKSLRWHLPLLDTRLTGYNRLQQIEKYKQMIDSGSEIKKPGLPVFAHIASVKKENGKPFITVVRDKDEEIIDFKETRAFYDSLSKSKIGNWAEFSEKDLNSLFDILQKDDIVAVNETASAEQKEKTVLSLTKIPELQGGIVVLKDGMIKAMVGGYYNQFLNRAVDSRRQLGSIFKPILFTAALQLKWNNLEPLRNEKNIFRFEDSYFTPRPDHDPVAEQVSMIWAGVKSENLASVWLLHHLIDKLNTREIKELGMLLGLSIKEEESIDEYMNRIRDQWGIMITDYTLLDAAFEKSKKDIETDLIFNGQASLIPVLDRINYSIDKRLIDPENKDRNKILHSSFKRLQLLNNDMKLKLETIKDLLKKPDKSYSDESKIIKGLLKYFYIEATEKNKIRIVYGNKEALSGIQAIYEKITCDPELLDRSNIWVDNILPSDTIDSIEILIEHNFNDLKERLKTDPTALFLIRDFRTLMGLLYVVNFSKELGISTKLDPVLSFPLGANAISIIEAAIAYQTIMTGTSYSFSDVNTTAMLPLITRITDRYGEVIWEYAPKKEKIISDRISTMVAEILRLAVERGTAQSAKDKLYAHTTMDDMTVDFPVAVYGKTGTSNDHTNSSFVGFIPGPDFETGVLDRRKGYVIACYVGYDDNRPMKGRHITVYGSSGALPIWVDTAKAIVNSPDFTRPLNPADLVFGTYDNAETITNDLVPVAISERDGLPVKWQGNRNILQVLTDKEYLDKNNIEYIGKDETASLLRE